jgi:hypothetical protein
VQGGPVGPGGADQVAGGLTGADGVALGSEGREPTDIVGWPIQLGVNKLIILQRMM